MPEGAENPLPIWISIPFKNTAEPQQMPIPMTLPRTKPQRPQAKSFSDIVSMIDQAALESVAR